MFKNKMLIFILIICLFITLSLGCSRGEKGKVDEKPPETKPPEEPAKKELTIQDVYPLNQGDYLKFAGSGNEYAAFEQKVLFREGDRIQLQSATGGTVMAFIYEIKDGQLMVVYSQEEFYEEENILNRENEMSEVILKEPIEAGNTWESGEKQYTIEAIDAVITTPAGEFKDCIQISVATDEYNYRSNVFYKPGLGLIKQEYISDDYQVVAELEQYNVKTFR
ncbi:MAG: hypothetical protein VR72_10185 [Clostridiaceae bacterium BRH_c20a]|nr:MAG: hypothetical protein VR72_10185 [Clostridiaceae bacterium BRH_c20a]